MAQEPSHATTESAEIHIGKGYEALKNDRYEEAVSEFRAALSIDPKLVLRARFPLAVALFEWQKTDRSTSGTRGCASRGWGSSEHFLLHGAN